MSRRLVVAVPAVLAGTLAAVLAAGRVWDAARPALAAFPADAFVVVGFMAVAGGAVFAWFVTLERRHRPELAVGLIVGLLLAESVLWGAQQNVGPGLFNLGFAGYSVRLPDVLIPLALAARVVARGAPRRTSWPAILLAMWALFYVAAAVTGILDGHPFDEVVFEAKAIVYVAGGFALAAGVPAHLYVRRAALARLAVATAVPAAVLAFTAQTRTRIDVVLPGIDARGFGWVGADTASLFVAVALLALALEITWRPPRVVVAVAGGVLLFASFLATQRGAVLGLAVAVVVIFAAWATPLGRRRFRVTPTEVGVATLLVAGIALVPVVVSGVFDDEPKPLPLVETIESTFFTEGDAQSAQQRLGQLEAVRNVIADRPVTGFGLGVEFTYFAAGLNHWETFPISHNIYTDLLMRTGIVGLLLFVVPVGMIVRDGIRAWGSRRDDRIAVLAMVCTALLLGLLAKGAVESLFEKFRLAVAIGLLLGMIRSATLATQSGDAEEPGELELVASVR